MIEEEGRREERGKEGEKRKGEKEGEGEGWEGEGKGRKKRSRNVVWRGIEGEEGEGKEERRMYVKSVMERMLGKRMSVRGLEERRGEEGRWVLIVEMGSERDKAEGGKRGEW